MSAIILPDFIDFLEALADDENPLKTLPEFDCLVDCVKIKADNWGSVAELNFHAAQYMSAVQKDVISAWNTATGQNVTLASLDKYPFLIVDFEIKDGCLNIKQALKLAGIVVKNLSPKQKMFLYAMIFFGVLAACTAYSVGKLADAGFFDSDDVKKLKILAQQKESTKVLINNVGDGTIYYEGREWDSESLKKDRKSVDAVSITENIILDGVYTIDTCKLESGIHLASSHSGRNFNADFDSLEETKRKILTERIADALLRKRKFDQQFRIDAKVKDGVIVKAHIIDMDVPPRAQAIHTSSPKQPSPTLRQGSLLDDL